MAEKIAKSMVREKHGHLIHQMMVHDLFSNYQYDSISDRSCTSQLVCVFEEVIDMLDKREGTDILDVDFGKRSILKRHSERNCLRLSP